MYLLPTVRQLSLKFGRTGIGLKLRLLGDTFIDASGMVHENSHKCAVVLKLFHMRLCCCSGSGLWLSFRFGNMQVDREFREVWI